MHHLFLWRGTSLSKNISVWYEQHTPLGSHPTPSSILMLSLAVIQQRHTKERSIILKPNNEWSGKFVANVIEHSSWEKSRRGRKCRFPPKGGLHHTSGDASLETHLKIPNWCHAYKSQSPSSRRTSAAAVEYQIVSQTHQGHSMKHRRCVNENRKRFKQGNYLREINSRKVASLNIQCLSADIIKNNIVVCDGGNDHKSVLSPPLNTT